MALDVIKGSDRDIVAKINDTDGDPYDLTGISFLRACFQNDAGSFYKAYIPVVGDTTSASQILSNVDSATLAFLSGLEGLPISGPGIPAGATIVSLPDSASSPSAANTIKISVNATATASAQSLLVGDVVLLSPVNWGKVKIHLYPTDTDTLASADFEIKLVKSGITSYVQYPGALNLIDRFC